MNIIEDEKNIYFFGWLSYYYPEVDINLFIASVLKAKWNPRNFLSTEKEKWERYDNIRQTEPKELVNFAFPWGKALQKSLSHGLLSTINNDWWDFYNKATKLADKEVQFFKDKTVILNPNNSWEIVPLSKLHKKLQIYRDEI